MAQAKGCWNSLFSTSRKPFPCKSGAASSWNDAGGGPGALGTVAVELGSIVDRIAYQKAAKVRLGGALGVWWDGVGLFLDGYVPVPTGRKTRASRFAINCKHCHCVAQPAAVISLNHGNRCNVKQH